MIHVSESELKEQEKEQEKRKQNRLTDKSRLEIYKNKGVIKIEKDDFEVLRKGKYLKSTINQSIPPQESNLIINKLPPEILMMICEYLSPGEFIRLGMTCKHFQEIFNDQETWRRIANIYQQFFISDYFELKFNDNENKFEIFGFQTPIIKEIDNIQIQNQNLNFPNLDQNNFKEFNQKRQKRLKQYFNNNEIDDSTMKDDSSDQRIPILNSTEEERIKYINLLENPKEEIIEKGRKIYQLNEELEIAFRNKIIKEKFKKSHDKIFIASIFVGGFFVTGFFFYLLLINLKIEKRIHTKLSVINLCVLIPSFSFWIAFLTHFICFIKENELISSYFKEYWKFFVVNVLSFLIFLQFLLIGLRVDNFFKCSWVVVFIPFLLFTIFLFSFTLFYQNLQGYEKIRKQIITFLVSFFFLFLLFIFLGLRIDEIIKWNYGIVFIPLYLHIITLLIGILMSYSEEELAKEIGGFAFPICFGVPFLLLIILYLEHKFITHIAYALIPLYLVFGLVSFAFIAATLRIIGESLPCK
ncbi:dactylin [Anaeramoeba ignava]|uniref:Dactylin n=1 Tax=Anaeramoeba ignava TaxID=1746090 RepID=A0A9Q0LLX8_ANAIG|nr:dactylin [Anaeramoeba ignava]